MIRIVRSRLARAERRRAIALDLWHRQYQAPRLPTFVYPEDAEDALMPPRDPHGMCAECSQDHGPGPFHATRCPRYVERPQ